MSTWTSGELDAVGTATLLHIGTRRPDGTLRPPVPIGVVRVGDDLYVRSYKGRGGAWFRHASTQGTARISAAGIDRDVTVSPVSTSLRDAIDKAYRAKYARYGSAEIKAMTTDTAAGATLRLIPVN